MRSRSAFMLLSLSLWACNKAPEEYKESRSPFQLMAERIGQEPPCSRAIPGEWSPSMPVPVLDGGRLAYRVFFYGWSGSPTTKIVVYDAQGDARFTPEGKVLECAQRPGERKPLPEQPMPSKTQKELDARVSALYGSIEEMGRLYARGMPVAAADRARLAGFSREFTALAGPGHAASYRSLSPAFWAWVQTNGGAAP
jgi:hypothetical protein